MFAALHLFVPNQWHFFALYGAGSVFAAVSLLPHFGVNLPINVARMFAVATTAIMFFYFAGFFSLAPHLHEYWYRSGVGFEAIGLLLSAFAMIPILSCYSCMLKAGCAEHMENLRKESPIKRPAFFSVPKNLGEESA